MTTNFSGPGNEAPTDIYGDANETQFERERRFLQATLNRVVSARVRAEDTVLGVMATGVRPDRAIGWDADKAEPSDSPPRSSPSYRNSMQVVMRVYAAIFAVGALLGFLYYAGLTSVPATPAGSEVLAQWQRNFISAAGATLVVVIVLILVGQVRRAELRRQLSQELDRLVVMHRKLTQSEKRLRSMLAEDEMASDPS